MNGSNYENVTRAAGPGADHLHEAAVARAQLTAMEQELFRAGLCTDGVACEAADLREAAGREAAPARRGELELQAGAAEQAAADAQARIAGLRGVASHGCGALAVRPVLGWRRSERVRHNGAALTEDAERITHHEGCDADQAAERLGVKTGTLQQGMRSARVREAAQSQGQIFADARRLLVIPGDDPWDAEPDPQAPGAPTALQVG